MLPVREDYPEFIRGKTYSWMRHPWQRLRGVRFEVKEVKTSSKYVETEKKIKYLDRIPGVGPPVKNGQQVTFFYTLYENGDFENPVKSTYIAKHPNKARLGKGEVCEGLDIGFEGMRVDGVRRIVVPPDPSYKYNPFGSKKYRVFDVKLLNVEG